MRYCVAACPRCSRRKICQTPSKTTACPSCGRRYHVPGGAKQFQTIAEARAALDSERALSAPSATAAAPKVARGSERERAEAALESLGRGGRLFTEEEFADRAEVADPERWLRRLIETGAVCEPEPRRYRLV